MWAYCPCPQEEGCVAGLVLVGQLAQVSEQVPSLSLNVHQGDMLRPVTGVFLSDNITRCGSVPVCVALISVCFTVFMACSAIPFEEGKPGLECTASFYDVEARAHIYSATGCTF
ncbi:hypothetical protein NHX12_017123, partial [Muraenolepis orangiensis]